MAKKHSNINTTQLLDSENNHIYPIVYWEDVLIFENGTEEYKRFLNDAAKRNAVTSTIMTNIDGTQGEEVRAHVDDWIPTYGGLLKYIEKKSPVFYRNVLDLSYDDAKKNGKPTDLPTLLTLTKLEESLTTNKLGSASQLDVTDHTTITKDIHTTKQDTRVIDVQSLKKLNENDFFGSADGSQAINLIKNAYTYDYRTGDRYQDCSIVGNSLKIPIIVGADGSEGSAGQDGKDAYVHIKWSANSNGSGMVDKPTGSTHYLGVCSTHSSSAPSTPASYNWKYVKGNTGAKGDRGIDGKDGTGVNILGTLSSVSQLPTTGTKGDAYLIDGILYVYVGTGGDVANGKWQNAGNIKGPKGDPGPQGIQGTTGYTGAKGDNAYIHIKYSEYSNGMDMVDTPTSSTIYMGVYSGTSSTAPTSISRYKWFKTRGPKGDPGQKGTDGANGANAYTHIKYSEYSTGLQKVDTPTSSTIYMGVYSGTSSTAPTLAASYKWFKTQGPKGDPGQKGTDGKDGNNFNPDTHMTTIINKLTGEFVKINSTASENKGTVKVEGEIWASSGFYEESDKRLKENIVELDGAISKLKQIPVVNFNFKDKDVKELGTIAQDVQKVFPELVTTNEDGYLAVEYNKLSMVAIAAVKEMDVRLSSLEKTVEELLKKINKLS